MAKVKYSKYDVYDFLEAKRNATLKAKLDPIDKLKDEMREQIRAARLQGINFDDFHKKINELLEITNEIQSRMSYSSGDLYYLNRELSHLSTREKIDQAINQQIDFNDNVDYDRLLDEGTNLRREIIEEFEKLKKMVKACTDGAQAVRNLKSIGFDVSSIPSAKTREVMIIDASNVNADLLGLPEENTSEKS
nr:Hypothetical protein PLANC_74 [Enterococcus phage Planchet]